MSKHINADELLNVAMAEESDAIVGGEEDYSLVIKITELMKIVDEMPSADVVEVVRCKDCKYSVCIHNNIGEDWFCDIKYNEWGEPWATSPEDFCDCGERKETE